MTKLTKEFLSDNEILFIGYSGKKAGAGFCKGIYDAFTRRGVKVYPVNSKENGSFDVKVYKSLDEIGKVPASAYVLLKSENTKKVIKQLADKGVKRILFQNNKTVDAETLNECSKMGIETAVGCPMMIVGSGIHKIHAFFAGVK